MPVVSAGVHDKAASPWHTYYASIEGNGCELTITFSSPKAMSQDQVIDNLQQLSVYGDNQLLEALKQGIQETQATMA